jgi:hypothetical protein
MIMKWLKQLIYEGKSLFSAQLLGTCMAEETTHFIDRKQREKEVEEWQESHSCLLKHSSGDVGISYKETHLLKVHNTFQ